MAKEPPRGRATKLRDFAAGQDLSLDPITRNLRRVYDEVAAEPLPDDLQSLLDQLDQAAQNNKRGEPDA